VFSVDRLDAASAARLFTQRSSLDGSPRGSDGAQAAIMSQRLPGHRQLGGQGAK
jgi:hypothetical protein